MNTSAHAATVSVGGLVIPSLLDENGLSLADGSIVQVGYLLGLDPSLDLDIPANSLNIDWNSFTAITGIGSPNSVGVNDTRVDSTFGPGTFFGDGLSFETADGGDFGTPSGIPVRLAVRVFDSTTGPDGAKFNTFTSSKSVFILENPNDLDPNAGRGDFSVDTAGEAGLFWQGTPFHTTVVPEPSTSLSALLGLALLVGARRRK